MLGEEAVRAVCVGLHHGRPVLSVSSVGRTDHSDVVRGELAVRWQNTASSFYDFVCGGSLMQAPMLAAAADNGI